MITQKMSTQYDKPVTEIGQSKFTLAMVGVQCRNVPYKNFPKSRVWDKVPEEVPVFLFLELLEFP